MLSKLLLGVIRFSPKDTVRKDAPAPHEANEEAIARATEFPGWLEASTLWTPVVLSLSPLPPAMSKPLAIASAVPVLLAPTFVLAGPRGSRARSTKTRLPLLGEIARPRKHIGGTRSCVGTFEPVRIPKVSIPRPITEAQTRIPAAAKCISNRASVKRAFKSDPEALLGDVLTGSSEFRRGRRI
ncbi:unnamed protein product [Schistosoma mattheei]|uniref:Uncharacterized protein n=2 Tax=Schistosoma TaxID=6181 RepID=A0A3P8K7X2_9TREM|nr:unnamed protein product [Schistosoma mattheei]